MTILDQLADHAKERVAEQKKTVTLRDIKMLASLAPKGDFAFEKALSGPELAFICECKKASPSKGIIAEHFPYMEIAKDYEEAGADAISVLTEPKWFLGDDRYLLEIAEKVHIPCLRKDFTVDPYMIYQAKALGASAVLLICSILSDAQIREYMGICNELGLSALVEAHDEKEVERALDCKARIIGVNNRNLKDFTVDTDNAARLRKMIPKNVLFVSESGVKTPEDVKKIREMGADAALVGETLMRADDKSYMLRKLKGFYSYDQD
ncbi:MAG: indole-3-glycerol phosphate synthase TrpC [Lachnospiraceae bacterium]|nr:indole-3-glycerol phosphate synthase TrpC [Lachnospiraceae bacterium]